MYARDLVGVLSAVGTQFDDYILRCVMLAYTIGIRKIEAHTVLKYICMQCSQ